MPTTDQLELAHSKELSKIAKELVTAKYVAIYSGE